MNESIICLSKKEVFVKHCGSFEKPRDMLLFNYT